MPKDLYALIWLCQDLYWPKVSRGWPRPLKGKTLSRPAKPACRRYRRVLYFLAATPYSTTFCRETWHNRAAEVAHAVTFDFSSGFYNRFPITGCRIRRFLCGIHHRRVLSRRDGFPARLLLYFLCFTSRLYSALPQEMSIAEPLQDRKKLPQTPFNLRRPGFAKKKSP